MVPKELESSAGSYAPPLHLQTICAGCEASVTHGARGQHMSCMVTRRACVAFHGTWSSLLVPCKQHEQAEQVDELAILLVSQFVMVHNASASPSVDGRLR